MLRFQSLRELALSSLAVATVSPLNRSKEFNRKSPKDKANQPLEASPMVPKSLQRAGKQGPAVGKGRRADSSEDNLPMFSGTHVPSETIAVITT